MKIAVVVDWFPALSETFILRQIVGFVALGHEVDIFSHRRPADTLVHQQVHDYGLDRRVRYIHDDTAIGASWAHDVLLAVHVGVRRPGALRLLGRERSAPYGGRRSLLPRLRMLLAHRRYDLVHCHFGNVGLAYRFAATYWGVPLAVSFHGRDYSRDPQQYGSHLYEPLFADADGVIVNSAHARERLEQLGCPPSNLHVLHYGVERPAVAPRVHRARGPDEVVHLLTVARLVEKKGVEYALGAVARAACAGTALRYEIIGDGPLRAELEALARSLGVADRVVFRGAAEQQVVQAALSEADLFLLPSVTAANGDQEGTPNVLMEASSYGVPVVSTFHSGIPEVVLDGRTGCLVAERDVPALADRIEFLAAHPDVRTTMGRAGRRHIEQHFDVHMLSRQLEGIYTEVVTRHRARRPTVA